MIPSYRRYPLRLGTIPYLLAASVFASAHFSANSQIESRPSVGYLGLHARSNRAVLDELNAFDGVTVTAVIENSPAAAACIRVGDVILRANSTPLIDPMQLLDIAETLPIGSTIHLELERDRSLLSLEATTVARLRVAADAALAPSPNWVERKFLGFEFTAPDPEANRALGIAPHEGILVLRVAPGGPIATVSIAAGSTIVRIDGETIHSGDGFLLAIESRSGEKSVNLAFYAPSGKLRESKVKLYRPKRRVREIGIPLLFKYARDETQASFSFLSGLFSRRRIESAVKYRVLWLINFETGAGDELIEVDSLS